MSFKEDRVDRLRMAAQAVWDIATTDVDDTHDQEMIRDLSMYLVLELHDVLKEMKEKDEEIVVDNQYLQSLRAAHKDDPRLKETEGPPPFGTFDLKALEKIWKD